MPHHPHHHPHHDDSPWTWLSHLWLWFRDDAWPWAHHLWHRADVFLGPGVLLIVAIIVIVLRPKTVVNIAIGFGFIVVASYLAWATQTNHMPFTN